MRKTEKCAILSKKLLSRERWNVELHKKLAQKYYKRVKNMGTAFFFFLNLHCFDTKLSYIKSVISQNIIYCY